MLKNLLNRIRTAPAKMMALPRNVKLFLFTVLAYAISVEGINIVLLNLYLVRLGYGTEYIGALNSVGMLIFALISLPIGAVQRFSSRQMLQFGVFMSAFGILGLGLSYYATANQAALLIVFRVISMVGLSSYFVHQLPFAMEITRPDWHDRMLAISMAVFSLSAFIGSGVGGLLPQFFGNLLNLPLSDPRPYQLPMFVAVLVVMPAIYCLHLIVDEKEKPGFTEVSAENSQSTAKSNWRAVAGLVVLIVVIRGLQTSGVGVLMTFYNVYFDVALNVETSRIGLVSGFGRLLGVPASLLIPVLILRFRHFKLVILSLLLMVVLMIPFALIPSWPVAAGSYIIITSMGSLRYLSFLGFTMSLVPENQRSLMSGAGEMAIGMGFAVSSFVGGYLIAWYDYREVFLFGAVGTTLGTLLFWATFRRRAATMAVATAAAH